MDVLPPVTTLAIRTELARRVDDLRLARGMIVGVTEAGNHRFVAHGDLDSAATRVDEHTLFEVGSVTKLFTALLLADLANKGAVTLEEPVSDLLPTGTRVPGRNGRAITLRDLAGHVSGLPRRPSNLAPNDPADPYADYTARKLYEFLSAYELPRTPGDTFEYSNVGVGLLGHALAHRSGVDFERLVRDRILGPLGMNDTVIALPSRLRARVSAAHDDSLDEVSLWNFDVLAGAGAFRSTASDMLRFLDAVCNPASSIAAMLPPLIATRAAGGFELGVPHPDGGIAISHSGATGGSRSLVRCVPNWGRGVVVLSNAGIDAVVDLGVHVLDPRFGLNWYRSEIVVAEAHCRKLVGRYRLGPNSVVDVTTSGDRLHARLSGQDAIRIFPRSEWKFFYKAANAQISFEPDSDGQTARLILHQNGLDRIAGRID